MMGPEIKFLHLRRHEYPQAYFGSIVLGIFGTFVEAAFFGSETAGLAKRFIGGYPVAMFGVCLVAEVGSGSPFLCGGGWPAVKVEEVPGSRLCRSMRGECPEIIVFKFTRALVLVVLRQYLVIDELGGLVLRWHALTIRQSLSELL